MSRRIGIALAAAGLATIVALRSCDSSDVETRRDADRASAVTSSGERSGSPGSRPRRGASADEDALDPIDESSEAARLARQGAPVVGVVRTEDGTPVPGAFVALGDVDSTYDESTTTGPDGRFAFDVCPSYSAVCAVAVRDGRVWTGSEPADGMPLDLDVVLRPPNPLVPVVLVRVRGHDGRLIPRAGAEAVSGPRRVWVRYDGESRVIDGWFTVSAARWRDGEAPVFIVGDARDADGHPLPYGPALVRVDLDGASVVDVTLPAGVTLSGRVDLPDGGPAAGTKVLLVPPTPAGFDAKSMDPPRELTATTDERGGFTFRGLAEGTGVLRVEEVKGVHAGSGPVDVSPGGRDVLIELRRAVPVNVAVRDASGHAVAGVNVELALRGEDWTVSRKTDAEGEVALGEFPAGAGGVLSVNDPGFVRSRSAVVAGDVELRVVLERDAQIQGRVVGPDGEPLCYTSIRVDPPGDSSIHWWSSDQSFTVLDVPIGGLRTLSLMDGERVIATAHAAGGDADIQLRWPPDDERLTIALPEFDHLSATTLTVRAGGRVVASADVNAGVVSIPSAALEDGAAVQIAADTRGNCVHLRDAPRHGFLRVQWTPTAKLGIQLTAPGGVRASFASGEATVDETFTLKFDADEDGHADVKLPPGRVVLTATARGGLAGSVVVDEGVREIELALTRR